MNVEQIASAIVNDLNSGLRGTIANESLSLEQLEDEVVSMRENVIIEWWKRGILQKNDLLVAINCINVDCDDPVKCCNNPSGKSLPHFEIPQLLNGIGEDAIAWIGAADRSERYDVYYSPSALKYRKYKKRNARRPYVYIEKTPNENGNYDGWIYNLPYVKTIAVVGIFKDPRELEKIGCDGNCDNNKGDFGSISHEVQSRLTKEKFFYYRQAIMPALKNDQVSS